LFRRLYAMEKIHGTSSKVIWKEGAVHFSPGGCKLQTFVSIFDAEDLKDRFLLLGHDKVVVYGEQYGGKQQGMSATYGKEARFVAFEVKVGDTWLNVPNAEDVTRKLGLEFVHYAEIDATLEAIDAQRDADSVQAIRNGIGPGKKREGVVLRPLYEFLDNRGERVVAKHKRDDFRETRTPRKVGDPLLHIAGEAAALEWVTDMRLQHVTDALRADLGDLGIEHTGHVVKAMLADVEREGGGEVVMNKETRRAISTRTANMWKKIASRVEER